MASAVYLSSPSPTRFGTALRLAIERHGPADGVPFPCVYYQEKGKLTTFIPSDLGPGALLKAPLTDFSTSSLSRADTILTSLDTTLPAKSPLRKFLPRVIDRIDVEGQTAWVESKIPGAPLSTVSSKTTQLRVLDECAEIIRELANTEQPPNIGWSDEQERDIHLSSLAGNAGAETADALARVLALLRSQNRSYLRKGDMTMSNVLVMNDHVSGLIDWDESGHSSWPLAPLADLILSWTWQREGLHRHQGLALLLSGDSKPLASGLDIRHLLEMTGFDWPELAFGSLCSTLDHAHHELKYLGANHRKSRVLSLLVKPLAVAAKYLDDHRL